jgi:hypothetical protein
MHQSRVAFAPLVCEVSRRAKRADLMPAVATSIRASFLKSRRSALGDASLGEGGSNFGSAIAE